MRYQLSLLLFASAALQMGAANGQSTSITTRGTCSPVVVNAQNTVIINHGCGAMSPERARQLQAAIDDSIRRQNFNQAQLVVVANLLNRSLADVNRRLNRQEQIIRDIMASGGLVRSTLDATVQNVGNLQVTLTRIEVSTGRVSIYFNVENLGQADLPFESVFATS